MRDLSELRAMPGVFIFEPKLNSDHRGWLAELYRQDSSEVQPAMCYLSETKPGISRGPHEHKEQTDMFVFLTGKWKVYLWDNRSEETHPVHLVVEIATPATVIVPPGVVHGYRNIGETEAMVLNFPNQLYKGKNKAYPPDEIRHESNPKFEMKV